MSWRLKLAVFLMLLSVLAWPSLALAPFLPFSDKGKALWGTGSFLFGQITWNVGLIIGGAEAIAKRQEILAWFRNLKPK